MKNAEPKRVRAHVVLYIRIPCYVVLYYANSFYAVLYMRIPYYVLLVALCMQRRREGGGTCTVMSRSQHICTLFCMCVDVRHECTARRAACSFTGAVRWGARRACVSCCAPRRALWM